MKISSAINPYISSEKLPGIVCFIVLLMLFRVWLGIQINFSHEDYEQIYLIGLENALSGNWSYWGPDVVWSKTRLPGALQGLLAGLPLKLTNSIIAPIVLSNIISSAGLIMLGFYAKRKFPKMSIYFLLSLLLLFPFGLFNGVVLLNTAYLIFTGALLFISVFELFVYREKLLLNSSFYFFIIGFSFLFSYQLHLTWVMYLPFIVVLFFFEWKRNPGRWWKPILYFAGGATVTGLTLLPTLIKYAPVIMNNAGDNITFNIDKIFSFFDLFIRYFGLPTFDLNHDNFIKLATEKSNINYVLVWSLKYFAVLQGLGIGVSLFFVKRSVEFKRIMLLFFLSLTLIFFLYLLSNKHLSMRTYILLYPIPVWMSLFSYSYLIKFRHVGKILNASLIFVFITALGVGISNSNDKYSFNYAKSRIERAIENANPYEFATRRKSIMDEFN